MGDRTTCILYLSKPLPDQLARDLVDLLGDPEGGDLDGLWMLFHDIDGGEMPVVLRDALLAADIAFAWTHGPGVEYAAGVWLFARTPEGLVYYPLTYEGQICLTVPQAQTVDTLGRAAKAHAFYEDMRATAHAVTGA